MEIRRITGQQVPLEDYYGEMAISPTNTPYFIELGRRMALLLPHLRLIEGPVVWAVTSHANLRLIASDDFQQQTLVEIRGWLCGPAFTFAIDYALPDGEVPWPRARVLLETHDLLQACEMVAYGLSKATGIAYRFRRATEPAETPVAG